MTTFLIAAATTAWLSVGYYAARRMARAWFKEWGDYDGMPTPVLFLVVALGPMGVAVWLVVDPDVKVNNHGVGARLFGGQR